MRGLYYCVVGLGVWSGCFLPLEAQATPSMRVLLASDVHQLEVRAERTIWVTDAQDQPSWYQGVLRIRVQGQALVLNGTRVVSDHVMVRAGDQDLKLSVWQHNTKGQGVVSSPVEEKSVLQVSGLLRLIRRGNSLVIVNYVDLEEYVKGVVPAEVNVSWHPEMLKVQAVAARTYALYQHMLSDTRDYDVAASTQDQVYRGRQGIDARVTRAVESTRGLVVTHKGAPIYAAFSSTAAGVTEDALVVWSKDLPYLKGVECPFDIDSPFYRWKASFKVEMLEKNLRRQGVAVGAIMTMKPETYSRAGRVATLRIVHADGEVIIRGEDLRKAIGYTVIPSTQFRIESVGQEIVLSGYGSGHAVGLCQWGAKELADLGYSFSSILRYYYPGTELRDASMTQAPPFPAPVPDPAVVPY